MATPAAKKIVNVKLRLEEDLYETLRALAQQSDRTVAGEMRRALRVYVMEAAPQEAASR